MTKDDTDLNALIGSRICHDLISPLGAIGNGIELLQMSGMPDSPEMQLITQSVESANQRIRFFRIAFGAASPGQEISETEIRSVLKHSQDKRSLVMDLQLTGTQLRTDVKLLFLFLQCCETALPWGGDVRVEQDGKLWKICATAPKMQINAELWSFLTQPVAGADIPAAQVHFALLPPELARQNKSLQLSISDNKIEIAY